MMKQNDNDGRRGGFLPAGRAFPALRPALFALLLLAGLAALPAQEDGVIRSESNQVFVPVTVSTLDGDLVTDLRRGDFHLLENGIEQEIANWAHEEVPLNVVFLMDASGSEVLEMTSIKKAIREFVSELHPEDRVALITFNAEARLILDWSNDKVRLDKALDRVFPKGNTVWYDALYLVVHDMLAQAKGKKVIISVTDGCDTGSLTPFQDVLDQLQQSDAQLYVFSKTGNIKDLYDYYKREYGGQYDETEIMKMMYAAEAQLQKMSAETGGRTLDLSRTESLSVLYKKLIRELRQQYYLSYQPYNFEKDGSYREIRVRVDRPGVRVRNRKGYYSR